MISGVPAEARSFLSAAAVVVVVAACTATIPPGPPNPAAFLRTRPELTGYRETSHYADVRKLVAPEDTAVVTLLRLHGIRVDRSDTLWTARGESFVIDTIITAQRPFQGHHEVRLKGHWERGLQTLPPRSFIVSTAQPRGALIVYLLEPESDDGFSTWNFFDNELKKGGRFPVRRIFDLSRRGRGAAARRSSASTLPQLQN